MKPDVCRKSGCLLAAHPFQDDGVFSFPFASGWSSQEQKYGHEERRLDGKKGDHSELCHHEVGEAEQLGERGQDDSQGGPNQSFDKNSCNK